MSRRDDTMRLRDMLDAAQAAIRVLGDRTADELENAEALALAVPHAVEIVGEAAMDEETANAVIMAARAHWFEGEEGAAEQA